MNHYLWWVPACVAAYGWLAFASIKNNQAEGYNLWFFLLMIPVPLWAVVSKVSKNVLFDGILYDSIMVTSFAVGMVILGGSEGFKSIHYVGMGLAIVGLILMKV